MRVAELFSSMSRKIQIGEKLWNMCVQFVLGLVVEELDIMSGGKALDLLDGDAQSDWEAKVMNGDYDWVILTWSRAQYSGKPATDPICSKEHPWVFFFESQGRAREGTLAQPASSQ